LDNGYELETLWEDPDEPAGPRLEMLSWEASCLIARGIVHEINNMLMGVGGRAEMALCELEEDNPARRYLKGISEGVDRISELTADLRRCLVFGEVNREGVPTEMNTLVRKAVGMIERADKGLSVEVKETPSPAVSTCDRHLALTCILMIMLETAEKTKGEILRVEIAVREGEVSEEEPLARCVEVNFSAFPGLSCRGVGELMERLGGRLTRLEDRQDPRVVLSFPPRRSQGEWSVFFPAAPKPARTVLLVDDEEMILDVGAGLLQMMGHEVIKAPDGRRAIELFEAFREKIDAVIVDYVMEGLDGLETIQRLRAIEPGVKVILASGYKEAFEPSVVDTAKCPVLQKPYRKEDLSEYLKEVLG
jgi:CheY-like chemotaxis protein